MWMVGQQAELSRKDILPSIALCAILLPLEEMLRVTLIYLGSCWERTLKVRLLSAVSVMPCLEPGRLRGMR